LNINSLQLNYYFLKNYSYIFLLKSSNFNLNNKNYIFKKYFNIFFKYNFLIYKHTNFVKNNNYIFQQYKKFNTFRLVLIYWSFYFKQLNNILNLFYYINFNSLNYYVLTIKQEDTSILALNWLNYKTKILYKFLNFFKIDLINLKKFNYISLLKRFFRKYSIYFLIILDIDISNFFFNFISKLNINMINIFSFNINFLNCLMYSNFIITLSNLKFYKILLINFFYDTYILAKFNKYIFFFKKFQKLSELIYRGGIL